MPNQNRPRDTSQENLNRLMAANDVDVAAVAKHCACTPELVYRWLNGTRRITDAKIKKLAVLFGVSEAFFKYGTPGVDTDSLSDIAAGVIDALKEHGIIETHVGSEQIGSLIAMVFADYEVSGTMSKDQVRRYIRLISPSVGRLSSSTRLKQ